MNMPTRQCNRISDVELLEMWNQLQAVDPIRSCEIILEAVYPDIESVDTLTLGMANERLIHFRSHQFGPTFKFVDKCPECSEGIEFSLPTSNFTWDPAPEIEIPKTCTLDYEDWTVLYYPIRLKDWAQANSQQETPLEPEDVAREVLKSCIRKTLHKGQSASQEELPDEIWPALSEAINEADPLAEICFNLECPKCSEKWESFFEPVDFIMKEIDTLAQGILYQIHTIATAYGWSEQAILELPNERRLRYIDIIEETMGQNPSWEAQQGQQRSY